MKGYIHSVQSLGTVDGPGVRTVVFTAGCPLRCVYCHNPDTWDINDGSATTPDALVEQILRFYPYIKDGGVTFSGGEPLMQAEFVYQTSKLLKEHNLHIALDTSGCIQNSETEKLLKTVDLILLDIKMTSDEDYKKHIGTELKKIISFLDKLQELNKDVWIRHVVVPGINDTDEDVLKLKKLICSYSCIKKIELLPFKNLCLEKYENMGIEFPLKSTPPMSGVRLQELTKIIEA